MKEFSNLKYDIETYFRSFFPNKRIDMGFPIEFIDVLVGTVISESFDTIEFYCIRGVDGEELWKV